MPSIILSLHISSVKKKNNPNREPDENEQALDNLLNEFVEESKSRIGGIKKILDDMEKRNKSKK